MDQLLVDEFQDTDPTQCALLEALFVGPDAPRLFLVGDPKQSIYGWRSADLHAYHDFVQKVLQSGGELHQLDVNFRSVPPILSEVSRLVQPIMQEDPGWQPAFQELKACPQKEGELGFQEGARAPVEHWVNWAHSGQAEAEKVGSNTSADLARKVEAAALAADIFELHAKGQADWKDFGILMRTTGAQDIYLKALRAAGVPYQVEGNRSFYQRREVIDAACLVRATVDPNDHLALVACLRSPLVGVPDAAWLPLWERNFPGLMTELRGPKDQELLAQLASIAEQVAEEVQQKEGVPGIERISGWQHSLIHAVRTLADLRLSFRVDPADQFVLKLRRGLCSEATEAARFPGPHRLANLQRFFRSLTETLCSEDGGPQAVLRTLRKAVSERRDEAEAAPGDEGIDAVRVMTIHKAKGLDFDQVYLVNSHAGSNNQNRSSNQAYLRGGQLEFSLFGKATLGFALQAEARKRVAEEELVRLLYVALTRARQRLVIGCGRARTTSNSLESLMLHRDTPPLQEWFLGSPEAATANFDQHGVLWRLPFPDLSSDKQARHLAIPLDLTQLEDGFSALQISRAQAKERQQRHFKSVASAASSHESARERRFDAVEDSQFAWHNQPSDRALAMLVGTLVHLALERIDLDLDAVGALANVLESLPKWSVLEVENSGLSKQRQNQALELARELLQRMDRGGILYDLFERKEQILGREIPILLPGITTPADEHQAQLGSGVIIGTLDLLYRDPASGQLVVADYKTDHIGSESDLQQLTEIYSAQGRLYLEAVARAFPAEERPRFELWFLAPGRIVSVNV